MTASEALEHFEATDHDCEWSGEGEAEPEVVGDVYGPFEVVV